MPNRRTMIMEDNQNTPLEFDMKQFLKEIEQERIEEEKKCTVVIENFKLYDTSGESTNKVWAICTARIDDNIVIKGVKVINGKNGAFVSMPSVKTKDENGKDVFKDVVYLKTAESREALTKAVMAACRDSVLRLDKKLSAQNRIQTKITILERRSDNIRGMAQVTIGNTVIKNVRIVEGKKGLFIAMPQYKNEQGEWNDLVYPNEKEMRNVIADKVMKEYKEQIHEKGIKEPTREKSKSR